MDNREIHASQTNDEEQELRVSDKNNVEADCDDFVGSSRIGFAIEDPDACGAEDEEEDDNEGEEDEDDDDEDEDEDDDEDEENDEDAVVFAESGQFDDEYFSNENPDYAEDIELKITDYKEPKVFQDQIRENVEEQLDENPVIAIADNLIEVNNQEKIDDTFSQPEILEEKKAVTFDPATFNSNQSSSDAFATTSIEVGKLIRTDSNIRIEKATEVEMEELSEEEDFAIFDEDFVGFGEQVNESEIGDENTLVTCEHIEEVNSLDQQSEPSFESIVESKPTVGSELTADSEQTAQPIVRSSSIPPKVVHPFNSATSQEITIKAKSEKISRKEQKVKLHEKTETSKEEVTKGKSKSKKSKPKPNDSQISKSSASDKASTNEENQADKSKQVRKKKRPGKHSVSPKLNAHADHSFSNEKIEFQTQKDEKHSKEERKSARNSLRKSASMNVISTLYDSNKKKNVATLSPAFGVTEGLETPFDSEFSLQQTNQLKNSSVHAKAIGIAPPIDKKTIIGKKIAPSKTMDDLDGPIQEQLNVRMSVIHMPITENKDIHQVGLDIADPIELINNYKRRTGEAMTFIAQVNDVDWIGYTDGCVHCIKNGKLIHTFFANMSTSPVVAIVKFERSTLKTTKAHNDTLDQKQTLFSSISSSSLNKHIEDEQKRSKSSVVCVVCKNGVVSLHETVDVPVLIGEWCCPFAKDKVVSALRVNMNSNATKSKNENGTEAIVITTKSGRIAIYGNDSSLIALLNIEKNAKSSSSKEHRHSSFVFCSANNWLIFGRRQTIFLFDLKSFELIGECNISSDPLYILDHLCFTDDTLWTIAHGTVSGWKFIVSTLEESEKSSQISNTNGNQRFTLMCVYSNDYTEATSRMHTLIPHMDYCGIAEKNSKIFLPIRSNASILFSRSFIGPPSSDLLSLRERIIPFEQTISRCCISVGIQFNALRNVVRKRSHSHHNLDYGRKDFLFSNREKKRRTKKSSAKDSKEKSSTKDSKEKSSAKRSHIPNSISPSNAELISKNLHPISASKKTNSDNKFKRRRAESSAEPPNISIIDNVPKKQQQKDIAYPQHTPLQTVPKMIEGLKIDCAVYDAKDMCLYYSTNNVFSVINCDTLERVRKSIKLPLKKQTQPLTLMKYLGSFLWCGTEEGKILIFSPSGGKIKVIKVADDSSFCVTAIEALESDKTPTTVYVAACDQKGQSVFLIGKVIMKESTKEEEIKEIVWIASKSFSVRIFVITKVSENTLWFGSESSVFVMDIEGGFVSKHILISTSTRNEFRKVSSIIVNGDKIWVSCGSRIIVFSASSGKFLADFSTMTLSPIVSLHLYDHNCVVSCDSVGSFICWVPLLFLPEGKAVSQKQEGNIVGTDKTNRKTFYRPLLKNSVSGTKLNTSKYNFRGYILYDGKQSTIQSRKQQTSQQNQFSLPMFSICSGITRNSIRFLIGVNKGQSALIFRENIPVRSLLSSSAIKKASIATHLGKNFDNKNSTGADEAPIMNVSQSSINRRLEMSKNQRVGYKTIRRAQGLTSKILSPFLALIPRPNMRSVVGSTICCMFGYKGVLYVTSNNGHIAVVSLFTLLPLDSCPKAVSLPLEGVSDQRINHIHCVLNTVWVSTHCGKVFVLDGKTLTLLMTLSPFVGDSKFEKSTVKVFCSIKGFITRVWTLFSTENESAISVHTLSGRLLQVIKMNEQAHAMAYANGMIWVGMKDTVNVYSENTYKLIRVVSLTTGEFSKASSPARKQPSEFHKSPPSSSTAKSRSRKKKDYTGIQEMRTYDNTIWVLKEKLLIVISAADFSIIRKRSLEIEHPSGATSFASAYGWVITGDRDGNLFSWNIEAVSQRGPDVEGTALTNTKMTRLRTLFVFDFMEPFQYISDITREKIRKEKDEARRKCFGDEPTTIVVKTAMPILPTPLVFCAAQSSNSLESFVMWRKGDSATSDDKSYIEFYDKQWKAFPPLLKAQQAAFDMQNEVPKIVKCQSYIRTFLAKKWLTKQLKRMNHVRELASTEESYVKSLTLLETYIIKPLKASKVIDSTTFDELFLNILEIRDQSLKVAQKLTSVIPKRKIASEAIPIGAVFKTLLPYLVPHIWYVVNHQRSMEIFTTLKKKPEFMNVVRAGERNPEFGGQSVNDIIIAPVQRLMRYDMLLAEIAKMSHKNDTDQKPISECRAFLKQITDHTNKIAGKKDTMSKVAKSIVGFDHLMTPSRFLIHEGPLEFSSKMIRTQKEHAFLFNNLLICTKVNDKSNEKKVVLSQIVDDSFIIESSDGKVMSSSFSISSKHGKIHLKAQSFEDKMVWLTEITSLMQDKEYLFSYNNYTTDAIRLTLEQLKRK